MTSMFAYMGVGFFVGFVTAMVIWVLWHDDG